MPQRRVRRITTRARLSPPKPPPPRALTEPTPLSSRRRSHFPCRHYFSTRHPSRSHLTALFFNRRAPPPTRAAPQAPLEPAVRAPSPPRTDGGLPTQVTRPRNAQEWSCSCCVHRKGHHTIDPAPPPVVHPRRRHSELCRRPMLLHGPTNRINGHRMPLSSPFPSARVAIVVEGLFRWASRPRCTPNRIPVLPSHSSTHPPLPSPPESAAPPPSGHHGRLPCFTGGLPTHGAPAQLHGLAWKPAQVNSGIFFFPLVLFESNSNKVHTFGNL
jgi:hypothetical protein